jgi:hypothetical protein
MSSWATAISWDCSASVGMMEMLVEQGLGRDPAELRTTVDAMAASGELTLEEGGGMVTLNPQACERTVDDRVASATSWIEEWLYDAEGCRLPLKELARRADEQGLHREAFDRALGALDQSGMLVQEGPDFVHRLACLPPPPPPEDPMERVASFPESSVRAALYLHVNDIGCRVTPAGRAATVEAMAAALAPQMRLEELVPPEVRAAVRARVEAVLDNPGGAYEIDAATGDLVSIYCSP